MGSATGFLVLLGEFAPQTDTTSLATLVAQRDVFQFYLNL